MSVSTAELQQHIDDLTPDMVPIVKGIETGYQMTQNNYGAYMSLLARFAGNDTIMLHIVSQALIAAGANKSGVKTALKINGPGV
jgi:hypothetical protein